MSAAAAVDPAALWSGQYFHYTVAVSRLRQPGVPETAKRLLCVLAHWQRQFGPVYLTDGQLASKLDVRDRQITNLLAMLETAGLIRRESGCRPEGGRGRGRLIVVVGCATKGGELGQSAAPIHSNRARELGQSSAPIEANWGNALPVIHCPNSATHIDSYMRGVAAAAESRGTPVVDCGRKGGEASSAPAAGAARARPPRPEEKAAAAAGMDKTSDSDPAPDGLTPLGRIAPGIQEQLGAAERDADGPQETETAPPAAPATEEPAPSLPIYPPLPHEATLPWGCVIDRTAPKERQRAAEEWALAFTLLINEKVEDGPAAELATLRGLNHVRGALWRWQRDKAGGRGVGWLVDMLRENWSLPPPPREEKPPDKGDEKRAKIEAAAAAAYQATRAHVRSLWEGADHVPPPDETDRAVDFVLAEVPENETLRQLRLYRERRAAEGTP